MKMEIVPLPVDKQGMPVPLTIVKMIRVKLDDQQDDDVFDEDKSSVAPGVYAVDSMGQLWLQDEEMTELLLLVDFHDPQLKHDRNLERKRVAKKKPKKRKRRIS